MYIYALVRAICVNQISESELSTVQNFDNLTGLPSHGAALLNLLDNVEARHHRAEHHVLPVQPTSLLRTDEELGAIRVRTRVGHGDNTRPGVRQLEVLVLKVLSVH